MGREKLKIGEKSLSGPASWSRFGYSSIHSKFLAHCFIDGKGRAPFGRACPTLSDLIRKGAPNFALWVRKGMPFLEGHAQLGLFDCLIGKGAPLLVRAHSKESGIVGNLTY